MEWKFNRNGIEETVEPQMWRWEAFYNDGTFLKQYADDGIFHQIGEVDQLKLSVFKMVSSQFSQVYAVPFDPNSMKLVHKYIQTRMLIGTDQESSITSYCFGYQTKNLRQNHQHLLIIIPNGEAIICGDENIIDFK